MNKQGVYVNYINEEVSSFYEVESDFDLKNVEDGVFRGRTFAIPTNNGWVFINWDNVKSVRFVYMEESE